MPDVDLLAGEADVGDGGLVPVWNMLVVGTSASELQLFVIQGDNFIGGRNTACCEDG